MMNTEQNSSKKYINVIIQLKKNNCLCDSKDNDNVKKRFLFLKKNATLLRQRNMQKTSCDTEDWSNDAENSALNHRNKLKFL